MGVDADCRLMGMGSVCELRIQDVPWLCQPCVGMRERERVTTECNGFVSPEYKVFIGCG